MITYCACTKLYTSVQVVYAVQALSMHVKPKGYQGLKLFDLLYIKSCLLTRHLTLFSKVHYIALIALNRVASTMRTLFSEHVQSYTAIKCIKDLFFNQIKHSIKNTEYMQCMFWLQMDFSLLKITANKTLVSVYMKLLKRFKQASFKIYYMHTVCSCQIHLQ